MAKTSRLLFRAKSQKFDDQLGSNLTVYLETSILGFGHFQFLKKFYFDFTFQIKDWLIRWSEVNDKDWTKTYAAAYIKFQPYKYNGNLNTLKHKIMFIFWIT